MAKLCIFIIVLFSALIVRAETTQGMEEGQSNRIFASSAGGANTLTIDSEKWKKFRTGVADQEKKDQLNGLSYLLSGSLAIIGGFEGQQIASDPLEKAVYTFFQTIGIASIGYGAYTWKVGDEARLLSESLQNARGISDADRGAILSSYEYSKAKKEHSDRIVRAITHGMIAIYNTYNGLQQSQENVKNTLLFIGGVNFLAALSYTF